MNRRTEKLNVDMIKMHGHYCFICGIIINDMYLHVLFTFSRFIKVSATQSVHKCGTIVPKKNSNQQGLCSHHLKNIGHIIRQVEYIQKLGSRINQ